jgi:hypothetical protein
MIQERENNMIIGIMVRLESHLSLADKKDILPL